MAFTMKTFALYSSVLLMCWVLHLIGGCKSTDGGRCNDPIVNPGVSTNSNDRADSYVPWWVIRREPNGAGVIAR